MQSTPTSPSCHWLSLINPYYHSSCPSQDLKPLTPSLFPYIVKSTHLGFVVLRAWQRYVGTFCNKWRNTTVTGHLEEQKRMVLPASIKKDLRFTRTHEPNTVHGHVPHCSLSYILSRLHGSVSYDLFTSTQDWAWHPCKIILST